VEDAFTAPISLIYEHTRKVTEQSDSHSGARASLVKKVLIGKVPDRGGRANEMRPKASDMGFGGRGGGRGGGGHHKGTVTVSIRVLPELRIMWNQRFLIIGNWKLSCLSCMASPSFIAGGGGGRGHAHSGAGAGSDSPKRDANKDDVDGKKKNEKGGKQEPGNASKKMKT
jgi:hypothetical protein